MSTRITLIVSDELNEALGEMAQDIEASKSEVLRRSLAIFKLAVDEKKQGHSLGVFDKENKMVTKIVGF